MGSDQSLIDYNPDDSKDDLMLNLNPMSYPNFGNYNMRMMSLTEIVRLPISEQMDFSDAITRRYAKNKLFHEKMVEGGQPSTDFSLNDLNETSVGNIAFMAYHNPGSVWVEQYEYMKKAILFPSEK